MVRYVTVDGGCVSTTVVSTVSVATLVVVRVIGGIDETMVEKAVVITSVVAGGCVTTTVVA